MKITVRTEESRDHRTVEAIARRAFGYPERIERGGIGCPYEHWMVNELRRRDGIKELSLVAEADGIAAGHIICSRAEVRTGTCTAPVLNIGPLSVLPEYQRQGIGRALILAVIERAEQLGFGAILFFGEENYYPRFGFREADEFGVSDAGGYNYPSFMGMELIPGYLSRVKGGRFFESDIYNDELNRKAAAEFDRTFAAK